MFGSCTDEMFKTTAGIYKIGPPTEYRKRGRLQFQDIVENRLEF